MPHQHIYFTHSAKMVKKNTCLGQKLDKMKILEKSYRMGNYSQFIADWFGADDVRFAGQLGLTRGTPCHLPRP
jgi:hypothetical protein